MFKKFCTYHFLHAVTGSGRNRKRKITKKQRAAYKKLLESSDEEEDSEDYVSITSVQKQVSQGKVAKRTKINHENYLIDARKQQKNQQTKQSSSSFWDKYKTEEEQKQKEKKQQEEEKKRQEQERKIKERNEMEQPQNREKLMLKLKNLIKNLTENFKLKSNNGIKSFFEQSPTSKGDYHNRNDFDTFSMHTITIPIILYLCLAKRHPKWSQSENEKVINIIKFFIDENIKFNYPVLKVSKQNQRRLFQVEEHDGRHRAIALLLLGYTDMPVNVIINTMSNIRNNDIIISENKKYDTEIENKKYWTKWVVPNQIDITSKDITYLINIFESIQQNANAFKSLLK